MAGGATYWLDDMPPERCIELGQFLCDAALIDAYADLFDARHPVHVDADYAAQTPFGCRIAQGPLPLAKALSMLGEVVGPSIESMSGMTDWRLLAPVRIGDTVDVRLTVRRIDRRAGAMNGKVTADLDLSVAGKTVQAGALRILVRASGDTNTQLTDGDKK